MAQIHDMTMTMCLLVRHSADPKQALYQCHNFLCTYIAFFLIFMKVWMSLKTKLFSCNYNFMMGS
jgi:hypothetical protein